MTNSEENRQDEKLRREREAIRRQREDRIRRKKRGRVLKTVLFALIVAAVAVALLIMSSVTRNGRIRPGSLSAESVLSAIRSLAPGGGDGTAAVTVSSAAEAVNASASGNPASPSAGQESTDVTQTSVSGAADVSNATDTPAAKEEALQSAQAFAVQYDYDRAIAALESISGYESDSDLSAAVKKYTDEKAACVAVDVTTVPHVFFHSLLNDDRGLRADVVGKDRAWKNDTAMATADEFDHMIEDMYNAGYVLFSLDDLCVKTKQADGSTAVSKNTNLLLPQGKKALVMSEDDLSYYHSYGEGTQGYATKMVLDENGEVKCEYTDENGETHVGDYDMVPRLDTFVKKHPDFSYHGHKATVALTGYDGVFGYRTNDYYKDINNPHLDKDQRDWLSSHPDFNWDQDVAEAKKIAETMKANGWTFASHTYAHWNASNKTAEQLKADNERWMTCVSNVVGKTDKIIFAFGGDIGGAGGYTADNPKYQYFKDQGYVIFCNVDGHAGWTEFGDTYMRTGRVALDGFTMYQAMTVDGSSHETYARSYDILGIKDVASFFNPNRITPITSE